VIDPLKIVVCMKPVPDTAATPRIDLASKRLVRLPGETILNPFDEFALEAALRLRDAAPEATVSVLALAPGGAKEALRKVFALGVDAVVHLCDEHFEGSDGLMTAEILAVALRRLEPDLVLCGTESTDGGGGYLPTLLAGLLDLPAMTALRALRIEAGRFVGERDIDAVFTRLSCDPPLLASIGKAAPLPRYASLKNIMAAKKKEAQIWSAADLGVTSYTPATELLRIEPPPARGVGRVAKHEDPTTAAEAILAFLNERHLV
jgi:electron transfer flavoprotein beta subunit